MPLETELSLIKSAVRLAGEAILRIAQEDIGRAEQGGFGGSV